MCLLVREKSKPKTAKRDITCYKILTRPNFGDTYYSLYRDYKYDLKGINKSKIQEEPESVGIIEYRSIYSFSVYIGLHTFNSLNRAIMYKDIYVDPAKHTSVFKCIIPKGAKYWTGRLNLYNTYKSRCSDKLIIKEKIV